MKILYVSDSAIPSASPNSLHVMKMCQAFAAQSHEVILHGKNTTNCLKIKEGIHTFYSVKPIFDVNIFPKRAFKGSGLYYNLSLLWRTRHFKADLIYTRSLIAAFFLLLYGRRIVFEVHEPFEEKGLRIRQMFRFVIGHSELIKLVVISSSLKQYFIAKFKLRPEAIILAHDAADPLVLVDPIIKDDRFKVGYIGSLLQGKGMEIIIPLARECHNVEFHVVGGNLGQIEMYKRDHVMPPNIVFHGFQPQPKLPAYLASFDVLIAPYSNVVKVKDSGKANNLALWMSPLKLFEYMSSGKPIIASSLPVILEVLTNGENALLCDPNNLAEWKSAIEVLKGEAAVREKISKKALDDFKKHFTWNKRASLILKAINLS